jgi:hypothetical protein
LHMARNKDAPRWDPSAVARSGSCSASASVWPCAATQAGTAHARSGARVRAQPLSRSSAAGACSASMRGHAPGGSAHLIPRISRLALLVALFARHPQSRVPGRHTLATVCFPATNSCPSKMSDRLVGNKFFSRVTNYVSGHSDSEWHHRDWQLKA